MYSTHTLAVINSKPLGQTPQLYPYSSFPGFPGIPNSIPLNNSIV